ncbi:hypothetical protein [Croceicoccus sp. BE223]|uniref:hypothetical protein n=1 Tax=Croceicoccus sp. BE223 TaxID=2817716 RepID=UPI002866A12F|nr:hypothetical protein [Croceicoccus sp. BE223]MDR7101363.1 hypothetical protein [Croceicoccus sp. BE223]
MGAIVIDRRSKIRCCTATRPPGFAHWPVEPGRFLDGTETEFNEGFYAALAVERLAGGEESRLRTSTGSGQSVDVHFLPIVLNDGDDNGYMLMIVGAPEEGLEHEVGNVVAEMRAVSLVSQRGAARLDDLAFSLCRRIDVLLALARLRHRRGDGRLPLGEVVTASGAGNIVLTGSADHPLLNEQAKAVALVLSDWHESDPGTGGSSLAARTSDVLELTWTGPAPDGEIAGESGLAGRILSRVDGWVTSERAGDALVRRLVIPIQ